MALGRRSRPPADIFIGRDKQTKGPERDRTPPPPPNHTCASTMTTKRLRRLVHRRGRMRGWAGTLAVAFGPFHLFFMCIKEVSGKEAGTRRGSSGDMLACWYPIAAYIVHTSALRNVATVSVLL